MTQWLIQIATGVVIGAIMLAVKLLLTSRNAQGERLGRLEKWKDFEEGRAAGRNERSQSRERKR